MILIRQMMKQNMSDSVIDDLKVDDHFVPEDYKDLFTFKKSKCHTFDELDKQSKEVNNEYDDLFEDELCEKRSDSVLQGWKVDDMPCNLLETSNVSCVFYRQINCGI
jgi:hypothetical protein